MERLVEAKVYHVWLMASTGNIFYRVRRDFTTRQAAHQWAIRRQPVSRRRMVLRA